MAPRGRPPLVLVAFGALVLLVLVGSILAPASPALEYTTTTTAAAAEVAQVEAPTPAPAPGQQHAEGGVHRAPWWALRLAAAKEGASSAYGAVHDLWTPSPSSPSPSRAPPSYASLGFHGSPSLPECAKTLLFRFHGTRGFASEYLRFVRTAAVARRMGYEVFLQEEDGGWMYGSVDEYFLPPLNRTCRLPPSAPSYAQRTKMLPLRSEVLPALSPEEEAAADFEPDRTAAERFTDAALRSSRWSRELHVADGYHIPYTSALFLALFSQSPSSLRTLHAHELAAFPPALPLPGVGTVPAELEGAFSAMAEVVKTWWRVDEKLDAAVEALGAELGDVSVGMHLRLGDKCLESANPKYSPLRFASPPQLAALMAAGAVRNKGHADECALRGEGVRAEDARVLREAVVQAGGGGGGRVAAMSDDPRGVGWLREAWGGEREVSDLAEVAARLGLDAEAEEGGLMQSGFSAGAFREAPLSTRVALTRPFIRDLTFLARHADALVLSQASNVGRLLTLLAGVDKVREGKVHSVNVRFFPTAYYA
ncbi:hypothetical protein JCM10449v2_003549 [Rhodotorula kratochvilovae]